MRALHTPPIVVVAGLALMLVGCTGEAGDGGSRTDGGNPATATPDDVVAEPDGAVAGDLIEGQASAKNVTPPGTALTVGERAIVPYRSPDGRVDALLAVSVVRIDEGDPADLDRIDVGDRASGAVPYYVTLSITKIAGDKLAGRALEPGFTVQLLDGSAALPIVPLEPFEPCRWIAAPDRIDRDGQFLTCDPYTVPEPAEVGGYAFVGEIGGPYDDQPIVWTEPAGRQ